MKTINVKISKLPLFILVTIFDNELDKQYHYHLDRIKWINRYNDIGCWKVKYKSKLN